MRVRVYKDRVRKTPINHRRWGPVVGDDFFIEYNFTKLGKDDTKIWNGMPH